MQLKPSARMETLQVQLFGSNLNLTYGETPIVIKSARLQSLLAYLLIHRAAPQPRQQLAFTFWPDATETQARNNLRQIVFDLRRALPDAECFVAIADATLQWRPRVPFTLDVSEFERALTAVETQTRDARRGGLERAVGIYQDDLLITCYDDWIIPERERLRQRFVRALEELIALLEEQREDCLALEYAQRLLRYDPLREETYRDLMRLASHCGDRTGILRHYRACVNALQRELGVEPSAETRQAYEHALSHIAAPPIIAPVAPRIAKTNLPFATNRFIGRTRELEQVKRLLATHRLVTLLGPGGVGKTRLALAIAAEASAARGVWFISLGLATNLEQVVRAIAATLDVREAAGLGLQDAVREYLRDKNLLLVLDNCEHLIAPLRDWVDELLRAAPSLRILATSRARFNIPSEASYRVPPLAVPEPIAMRARRALARDRLSEIAQYDSVQLFCDRATAILPTFELSAETAPFVAGICQRLDGLPLAIELAAARMNVLSAEQIYQRLDAALNLLTRGRAVALPHQKTLQATLAWSCDLLSTEEQMLLRRLAVFAGSFDLDAIEQVCDLPAARVLDVLSDLVDKSLVESQPTGNVMRYRLLQVVRQFAWVKLREAGEEQALRRRHCDYFTQWAERGEPELRGAEQLDWFARFEREHDNLRAAMEFCQQSEDAENGLRLASALWWFWRARGYLSEGRARVAQMLALASNDARLRARALNAAGFLALFQGDFSAARQHAQSALAIAQAVDDKQAIAMALYILGDDVVAESVARAIALRQQGLALATESGDQWMMAFTLNALGELERLRDDYAAARACYERALQIRREIQDKRGIAVCLTNLGFVAYRQGETARARELLRQVLAARWELHDVIGVAETLVGMVGVTVEEGRHAAIRRAARWLGSLSAELDDIWTPLTGADRREFETVTARVRACLGDAALQRALEEGRRMSLEQAVADALGTIPFNTAE